MYAHHWKCSGSFVQLPVVPLPLPQRPKPLGGSRAWAWTCLLLSLSRRRKTAPLRYTTLSSRIRRRRCTSTRAMAKFSIFIRYMVILYSSILILFNLIYLLLLYFFVFTSKYQRIIFIRFVFLLCFVGLFSSHISLALKENTFFCSWQCCDRNFREIGF